MNICQWKIFDVFRLPGYSSFFTIFFEMRKKQNINYEKYY